jgi:hypothetical protein
VAAGLAVAVLAGCSQAKSWLSGRSSSLESAPVIMGAPEADVYLNEMYQLAAGDPATQAEIFADAESRAKLTPNPSTELRFALVLATPGHPETNPEQAQSMLREILTQLELLTPAEVSLATINLKAVEELIVLRSETSRLRSVSSRQARTQEQAMTQRLATVEAENRQLRRALEDAEDKLQAITSIERSIRDQE